MKLRVPLLVLAISLVFLILFRLFPAFMDTAYSGFLYMLIAQAVSPVVAFIPFSLAEFLIYLLGFFLLFYLLRAFVILLYKPFSQVKVIWKKNLLFTASLLLWATSAYMLTCGLHYHRLPLEDRLGYEQQQITPADLTSMAGALVHQVNKAASYTRRNPQGVMIPDHTFDRYKKDIALAYDSLAVTTGLRIGGRYPATKVILASRVMSYAYVSGFFFPWTLEANVNKDVPVFTLPAIMAHEQAHVRGFMRENEANFLAYLVARHTGNGDLKYSCLLHSLRYVLNAVYDTSPEAYSSLLESLSARVRYDMLMEYEYWEKFRSSFGVMSQKVNDAYLKANAQPEGVASYGKVVDLMIADFKIHEKQVQQNPEHSVYIGEGTL
ncbi:MAG TPA: DUF3810 domain-containing protein [Bacteroidales bacterium]|nr:MAG: hypothetical protein BWX93_00212 [Bacteroidetes bacterium ADurb.Bin139]HOG25233.1 DUF3810 domain-containing protein [Bacteroidales bacterium]HOZ19012.1 DUF3810 domain-containing protein [Bacteroidales bacterium]HPB77392.1 DUF3810 domain-containing protein [Bacteroidales bacterium]HPJ82435.1 DUF3810 domain-containing protein [Bacteroidales bacterium]